MPERSDPLIAEAERARATEATGERAVEEQREPMLLFRVGTLWLACPATNVEAILEMTPATPVPRAGPHIVGLVSHGDCPLAVVDLAHMLGVALEAERPGEDVALRRIVVAHAAGLRAGLMCERAAGIIELGASERPPPSVLQGASLSPFLSAEAETARGRVGILDLAGLLQAARVRA